MTSPENGYALEERARGMAMEMHRLLVTMHNSVSWQTLENWQPAIKAILDKVESKE